MDNRCLHCQEEIETDYPMCKTCTPLRHFFNQPCRCESCANPEIIPEALRQRFPGLVLIAKSSDPAGTRRVELSLDAIKPECRLPFAEAIRDLLIRAA